MHKPILALPFALATAWWVPAPAAEAGWKRLGRLLRCRRDRSAAAFPNAGYEPHPLCGDCPLPLVAGQKERPKYPEKSLPDNNR